MVAADHTYMRRDRGNQNASAGDSSCRQSQTRVEEATAADAVGQQERPAVDGELQGADCAPHVCVIVGLRCAGTGAS